jgi:hypothetical protein
MPHWVRFCFTLVDSAGRPLTDDTFAAKLAFEEPGISYCGRLDLRAIYTTDGLSEELDRPWICRACGGREFDFTEWPLRVEVDRGAG